MLLKWLQSNIRKLTQTTLLPHTLSNLICSSIPPTIATILTTIFKHLNTKNLSLKVNQKIMSRLLKWQERWDESSRSMRGLGKMWPQEISKRRSISLEKLTNCRSTNNISTCSGNTHSTSISPILQIVKSLVRRLWRNRLTPIWRIESPLLWQIISMWERIIRARYLENLWLILLTGDRIWCCMRYKISLLTIKLDSLFRKRKIIWLWKVLSKNLQKLSSMKARLCLHF